MRILVVDDNDQMREMLRLLLESDGHEVSEAENGRRAVNQLKLEPVDLVITDIIMPEMEGIDLIMTIRTIYPDVKIIAISGGGRIAPHLCLKMADKLGADRILQKPFSKAAILSMIGELLDAAHTGNVLVTAANRE
jgi:CheY-like chemotaxis protein